MFKNAFFAMFLALMFCAPAMSHDTDPDQTVLVGIMTKCNRGVPAKPLRAYTKPWKNIKLSAETHRKLSSMSNKVSAQLGKTLYVTQLSLCDGEPFVFKMKGYDSVLEYIFYPTLNQTCITDPANEKVMCF